jgi:hypothetical protein
MKFNSVCGLTLLRSSPLQRWLFESYSDEFEFKKYPGKKTSPLSEKRMLRNLFKPKRGERIDSIMKIIDTIMKIIHTIMKIIDSIKKIIHIIMKIIRSIMKTIDSVMKIIDSILTRFVFLVSV